MKDFQGNLSTDRAKGEETVERKRSQNGGFMEKPAAGAVKATDLLGSGRKKKTQTNTEIL